MPPVFVNDVAVFYYKESSNNGYLAFYKWNDYTETAEIQSTVLVDTSTSTEFHKYTLIKVTDGVIFKENGATAFKHFKTDDYTWTESAPTWDENSIEVGTASASALVLM